ncbi:MAG: glycoside hydrolase family 9 protein [Ruminococcus sp.]|nr:glycoside hydrolase family 9 protein [Ruminococcus sp.]
MKKLKFGKRILSAFTAALMACTSGALSGVTSIASAADDDNYAKLLQYSMYFYDANMCGSDVGSSSQIDWRDNCHTYDEVLGGFHDAGDHAKFGLPAGYTASTLGWGYYEFKDSYDKLGQTSHLKAITDRFASFFKASTKLSGDTVTNFCYQVGNGDTDHSVWCAPEVQEKSTRGEALWTTNGASDIAAEYAAALAANYVNFGNEDDLKYAKALYNFSLKNNNKSAPGSEAFYSSYDYIDDQAWAAAWLYLATKDNSYKDFLSKFMNGTGLGSSGNMGCQWGVYSDHSWNNVSAGTAVLNAEITGSADDWKKVSEFIERCNFNSSTYYVGKDNNEGWGTARYNTAMQLVALAASKHSSSIDYNSVCKSQMSMILGNNPKNTNFVVGFSSNSAKYPHHRAASGYSSNEEMTGQTGYSSNGHTLVGALVGGPKDSNFTYTDTIQDYVCNEVALDYNAGLVGAAAGLYEVYGTGSVDSKIEGVSGNVTPGTTTTPATTTTTKKDTTTTTKSTTTTKELVTTEKQTTTTKNSSSDGAYSIKPNKNITYAELPADDKMIGFDYADFGIKTDEKVLKVEFDISTKASKLGKWQGAFGSSTTVDPGYWTQTDDQEQTFSGKTGTLVWDIDAATSNIIQTQYGGQVKVGFWWIDAPTFTIDEVRVYTDKSAPVVTTTSSKATTTTTKATTTTVTTKATTTTQDVPKPDGYGWDIGKNFVEAGQANAKVLAPTVFNSIEVTGNVAALKPSAAAQALLDASTYKKYERNFDYEAILTWAIEPGVLAWSFGKQDSEPAVYTPDGEAIVEFYYDLADEATVKAIAQEYGLELKSDAEHGSYYEFPVGWDTEAVSGNDFAQSYVIEDETGTPVAYQAATIDGSICVVVSAETTTTTSGTGTTTTTTTIPVGNVLVGDVNVDGKIGLRDLVLLNRALGKSVKLNAQQTANADCCSDSTEINTDDSVALCKYLAGLVKVLPTSNK